MTLELKPEIERLVQEEIRRGRFHSVDEVIEQAVYALRDKHEVSQPVETPVVEHPPEQVKSLAQLFAESPFKGLAMSFERFPDVLPPVDL
jgi:hypothetical protein